MPKPSLGWLAFVPFVLAASPAEPPPPAPVPPSCPALAARTAPIDGLVTGQAVGDGETFTVLQFSSETYACGEWSNVVRHECRERWNFSLSIPQGVLRPGTYELAKLGASFGDLFVRIRPDPGCSHDCASGVKGIGSISLEKSEATLTIDSADDACITGTIADLYDPHFTDAPSFNGAFFAVRCKK